MDKRANNPNIADYGFGGKHRTREQDDEIRRRKKPGKWSREKCVIQLEELMDILKKKVEDDDFKQLETIISKMMEIIRYLYPPVQQSVNVNIETTSDVIVERLKNWKRKQIIVMENDK